MREFYRTPFNCASLCAKLYMASLCFVKCVWPHATASTSAVYKLALLELTCSKELPIARTLYIKNNLRRLQKSVHFIWPTKEIDCPKISPFEMLKGFIYNDVVALWVYFCFVCLKSARTSRFFHICFKSFWIIFRAVLSMIMSYTVKLEKGFGFIG